MIDLEKPQHFTKEQSEWIKAYCIIRNKEAYNQALDDLSDKLLKCISIEHNYPYLGDSIYCIVNDALVDARKELNRQE